MLKTTPQNLCIVFGAMVVVTILYIFLYWPNSPLGQQLHNLQLARQQANLLRERFKTDMRFQQVKFMRYTDLGGCLKVAGLVSTEADFYYITNAVGSANCPVAIEYELMTTNYSARFFWFSGGRRAPVFERANSP
jgi:hypothetical protein